MQNDIDIFKDYESFKIEKYDLLEALLKIDSKSIRRFIPVIKVVDYLFFQNKKHRLSEDELVFFKTGFDYIFDKFHLLETIYENTFKKNLSEMEKVSKTINFYFYVDEFIQEANNIESPNKALVDKLKDLSVKAMDSIEAKVDIEDEYFQILDDICDDLFINDEVTTIDEIFYQIAIEYDLEVESSDSLYNDIINYQIAKNRVQ